MKYSLLNWANNDYILSITGERAVSTNTIICAMSLNRNIMRVVQISKRNNSFFAN